MSVKADESALADVFVGFVSDSVKFHPHGSPTIRLTIGVEKAEPPTLVIVYQDDGPGVRPDIKEAIFEPFFSTCGDAVGIGLAERQAGRQLS